ncbi:hypothetical protein ACOTC5_29890 [Achromobacter xylosoxidans]
MLIAVEYDILRGLAANCRVCVPLERKPVRVATLLKETQFVESGGALVHHHTVFLEDKTHDWDWDDGTFRYYTRVAQKADVVVAYQVQDVSKFKVDDWVLAFKENHALHHSRKFALTALLQQVYALALTRAAEEDGMQDRVAAVQGYLANLRDAWSDSLKFTDWRLEVYRWLASHKGFAHLVGWQSKLKA